MSEIIRYHYQIVGHPATGLPFKYKVWRRTPHQKEYPSAYGTAVHLETAMDRINATISQWEIERMHNEAVLEGYIDRPKSFGDTTIPDSLPENWETGETK